MSALARLRAVQRHPLTRAGAWAFLVVAVGPVALTAAPWLMGADDSFVVLTGSMSPSLEPGDIIFVDTKDAQDVRVGDVITFRTQRGSSAVVTHRVIEVLEGQTGLQFRTRGDANEDADAFPVPSELVVGVYRFHLPVWGKLLILLRSRLGYLLLIVLPGLAILGREFVTLYRELDAWERTRAARRREKEVAK